MPFATILFFFLSLFLYSKIAGPVPFSVSSVNTNKSEGFSVSVEGKVTAKPDSASISFGVSSNGSSVKVVQDQMNSNINKVTEAIKKLGIKEEDIKTTNYNVYPSQDAPMPLDIGLTRPGGYSASTNITVKIKDIELVNQVIDSTTESGANQIGGVNFEISDRSKLENDARQLAVTEAKKKAQAAADIAGFKLGRVINYSENEGGPVYLEARPAGAARDSTETKIEPGTNEIVVNVSLTFEVL